MSLWNSFSYSFKEFHYLFLSVVIIFIFNILLEYNNFLKFKNQKHYFINNALLTHQYNSTLPLAFSNLFLKSKLLYSSKIL